MSMMNFRISKKLREKMRSMKYINWSEELRKAIEQIIDKEEKKNPALAILLNERNIITPDEGWKSLDEIKKWRQIIRWKQ